MDTVPFIKRYFGAEVAPSQLKKYQTHGITRRRDKDKRVVATSELSRHSFVAVENDGLYNAIVEQSLKLRKVQVEAADALRKQSVMQQTAENGDTPVTPVSEGTSSASPSMVPLPGSVKDRIAIPNCIIVTLHAGEPTSGKECQVRCILTSNMVHPGDHLFIHHTSIERAANDKKWYTTNYFEPLQKLKCGLGNGDTLPNKRKKKSNRFNTTTTTSAKKATSIDDKVHTLSSTQSFSNERLYYSSVDPNKVVPLQGWPAELPYYYGVGERHRSTTFIDDCQDHATQPYPQVGYPYNLLSLEECPEIGEGQLKVVTKAPIPYGTCFLYTGFFRAEGEGPPEVAKRKQRARNDVQTPLIASEETTTSAKETEKTQQKELSEGTYAFSLSETTAVYGQSLPRYINHRYNFENFGNVQFAVLHMPNIDGKLQYISGAATAAEKRSEASQPKVEQEQTPTTTKKKVKKLPRTLKHGEENLVAVPFFIAVRDIQVGEQLLANTYGEAYDARLERAALCNDQVLSARDKIRPQAEMNRHYRADYKAVVSVGELVARSMPGTATGCKFYLVLATCCAQEWCLLQPLHFDMVTTAPTEAAAEPTTIESVQLKQVWELEDIAKDTTTTVLHVPNTLWSTRSKKPMPPNLVVAKSDTVALLLQGPDYMPIDDTRPLTPEQQKLLAADKEKGYHMVELMRGFRSRYQMFGSGAEVEPLLQASVMWPILVQQSAQEQQR